MKKNVAILSGGYSREFDVSIQSGDVIYENIDRNKYSPFKIVIKKDSWLYHSSDGEKIAVNKEDFSIKIGKKRINFDVIIIMIHGSPGEDGILQSYFDLLDIPYTGCDSYTSSLTFNKRDCISVLNKYNIPTAKSVHVNGSDIIEPTQIIDELGLPCFVKANKSGSSFGVFKVHSVSELSSAVKKAFEFDNEILIESFLEGTEVSVGVMKYKNETVVFGITELISENDFFDYDAKYHGQSQEITPANISTVQRKNVSEIAVKIYNKLGIKGISRSEFIFVDQTPHFLELNSIPGMTNESIFPKQAKNIGISIKEIIDELIEQTLI
ncbi:MAG: D-alanine--D-alanine ligase [Flavobacteriaceae bacterium]|nr:D-alanine--D-alanine ligase [Flavobacteriaceae bacterium]